MRGSREYWKTSDRLSTFVISLVVVLVLLLVGLIIADRSLQRSVEDQAMLDATTSAKIVSQEVELAGERLYELGAGSATRENGHRLQQTPPIRQDERALQAVWLLDTLGTSILDSAWWKPGRKGSVTGAAIQRLAMHVAASRHLQLEGLSGRTRSGQAGVALLGEPVIVDGRFTSIAIALVDEGQLLAPAANAIVQGRSFLALLVDGDTVAKTPHGNEKSRQSAPVRVPLPGQPAWFVISAQVPRENAARAAMWAIGTATLVLLLYGLVRERRQTARIAERSIELERLSAELLRANRMKSEFLAGVSHELRTPLNAIVGFVDLLRDGGYGALSERQISPVDRIATSANRLRDLVDQVLDIAKIAAGRLDVRPENLALWPFLTNIVNEIEPLVREKGLNVVVDAPEGISKVRTDPTHLRQIMINLLGNAVKYTEHGEIRIRAHMETIGPPPRNVTATGQHVVPRLEKGAGWAVIDVTDTGIGIAPADQERIFDEFEQVRQGNTREGDERGTGLGLSISRRLATLLGGDVTVESAVGQGSTFSVWLPIHEQST